jgi:hypothetical protein
VVAPTLTYLKRSVAAWMMNHPLFVNPPVYHPLTQEVVKVGQWRLWPGLVGLSETVVCSIYPYHNESLGYLSSDRSSCRYEAYDLGDGVDRVTFHLVVEFNYNEVGLDQTIDLSVPQSLAVNPKDYLSTSMGLRDELLYIHPPYEILGDYIEVTRSVLCDPQFKPPMELAQPIEIVYANLKTPEWETKRNVYFHEAQLLIKIEAYISRNWRKVFVPTLNTFNIDSPILPIFQNFLTEDNT